MSQVLELGEPGWRMLQSLAPAPLPADLFAKILDRIEVQSRPSPGALPLPDPILGLLPGEPRWKGFLLRGFRFLRLLEEAPRGAGLYLVHLAAGTAFPSHRHGGLEESVILAGGLEDGGLRFEAGDWASAEAATSHSPRALPDEDCWLVARMEEDIRFTGWRGLVQRLASR
jgi:putative transcriptional regulator